MKAGLLKEKVFIYKPVITKTDFGDTKVDYELYYPTRAAVLWNSGNRENENNEIFFAQNKTFIIRSYVPITEQSRIKFNGKFYRVLSVEPNKVYNNLQVVAELINE